MCEPSVHQGPGPGESGPLSGLQPSLLESKGASKSSRRLSALTLQARMGLAGPWRVLWVLPKGEQAANFPGYLSPQGWGLPLYSNRGYAVDPFRPVPG